VSSNAEAAGQGSRHPDQMHEAALRVLPT